MNRPDIAHLQHWMTDVITCQGDMQYKLRRAEHLHQLHEQDVVADKRNVPVHNRINVYAAGYVMRLLECLRADFPILQKFLGTEVFDKFARASLMWSPSRSYTLYDLGDTFIQFLVSTKPSESEMSEEQSAFFDLPIEIAKTERARHEAMRAKGLENSLTESTAIIQEDILFGTANYRTEVPDCLRLLELKFPLKLFIERLYSGLECETPQPQKTYLAISRMNYRFTMEELEEWQYVFLSACRESPVFSTAVDRTAEVTGIVRHAIIANLCFMLPWFQEKGFVHLSTLSGT